MDKKDLDHQSVDPKSTKLNTKVRGKNVKFQRTGIIFPWLKIPCRDNAPQLPILSNFGPKNEPLKINLKILK